MSSPSTGFEMFAALPRLIAARIREQCRADATVGFEVFHEDQADLVEQFRIALVSRAGLAVTVLVHDYAQGDQPGDITAKIMVHIDENVMQNQSQGGTKIPARQLAMMVYGALTRFGPTGWSLILPESGPKLSNISADPDNGIKLRVSYEIPFICQSFLSFTPAS